MQQLVAQGRGANNLTERKESAVFAHFKVSISVFIFSSSSQKDLLSIICIDKKYRFRKSELLHHSGGGGEAGETAFVVHLIFKHIFFFSPFALKRFFLNDGAERGEKTDKLSPNSV